MVEAKLGSSSSKPLVIADASAHVVAEGSGQMALFLSASALQGCKPLLFTMVATNLLCSSIEQHPTVVGTLLLIMSSVNRDNLVQPHTCCEL